MMAPELWRAAHPRRTNWSGCPCPACAEPLSFVRDLASTASATAVLLGCERGHRWQELIDLRTGHSGVFVERRRDLEPRRQV